MESPTLISVWTFDEERRQEVLDAINAILNDLLPEQPGFRSARLYQSADGNTVVAEVQMRSVAERQAVMELPHMLRAMRELRAIAHTNSNLYRLVTSVEAPD
jgi:hypothetical protein